MSGNHSRCRFGCRGLTPFVVAIALFGPVPEAELAVAAALCQIDARLYGKVTDTDGNPVPRVKVTVVSLDFGETMEIQTNDKGEYFRRGLRAGRYLVRVEKEGYQVGEREIRLRGGLNTIDVTIEVLAPVAGGAARLGAAVTTAFPDAYARGNNAFTERRFPEAIAIMQEVVAGIQDADAASDVLVAAWTIIGRSHLELGHFDDSIKAYESVLALRPDRIDVNLDLGNAYAQQGEPDRALAQFRRAMELAPEDARAQYNAGVMLLQADQVTAAIEAMEAALVLRPVYPLAHKSLGYAYAQWGEYAKAVEHLGKYLEQAPDAQDAAEIRGFIALLR